MRCAWNDSWQWIVDNVLNTLFHFLDVTRMKPYELYESYLVTAVFSEATESYTWELWRETWTCCHVGTTVHVVHIELKVEPVEGTPYPKAI
jgi:hypothetical protein